jgi:hypothetical protein
MAQISLENWRLMAAELTNKGFTARQLSDLADSLQDIGIYIEAQD